MRAWLCLMSQELLTKETERKAKLVRNVHSSASSSLQTETSSMSPNEEEAALQKDPEEESSGNGEVLNPTKHSHHTLYLSFFLHEQNFWRIKFTPKKTRKFRQNTQKIANF